MPKTFPDFLTSNEPAVKVMFEALAEYDALPLPRPLVDYLDDQGVVAMSREEALEHTQMWERYFALEQARATLCGSIAQIAYTAMNLYSTPAVYEPAFEAFAVKPGSPALRFCTGRRVHGIPLGLLVYAARVQYNHWDEGTPKNPVPKSVLNALYVHYAQDLNFDLAYELDWPHPRPVSHLILRNELQWFAYSDYENDLRSAIEQI